MKARCETCFRHCELEESQIGFCGARQNKAGKVVCTNYGLLTSIALDPIEKKPFAMFFPGKKILSLGSFGCDLACPFCQNYSISKEFDRAKRNAEFIEVAALVEKAFELQEYGNIGIAFTYNEPLVGWEFVRDTARLVHERGMKNAIVTNGSVLPEILDEILPYTDAMNIDLKAFSEEGYKKLGGDFKTVQDAIKICAARAHVELTTLIVPGFNGSAEQMREEAKWISSIDKNIALHITRFFPRYKMQDSSPTSVQTIYSLASIAREFLPNVFAGNC